MSTNPIHFFKRFVTTRSFHVAIIAFVFSLVLMTALVWYGRHTLLQSATDKIDNTLSTFAATLTDIEPEQLATIKTNTLDPRHSDVFILTNLPLDYPEVFVPGQFKTIDTDQLRKFATNEKQSAYSTIENAEPLNQPLDNGANKIRIYTFEYRNGQALTIGYHYQMAIDIIGNIGILTWIGYILFISLAAGLLITISYIHLKQTDTIYASIEHFVKGDLNSRIPQFKYTNELSKLGQRINGVLNRAEYFMNNNRQITNNIAHDLRKPLTRIKNRLELLVFETEDENQIEELNKSIHDADNLLKTFNELLSISQAESGSHREAFECLSLKSICEDMTEMYLPTAEELGINIYCDIQEPLEIAGSRQLIMQLINNLIDNACKYAGYNGSLTISGEQTAKSVILRFADDGPGVPEELREKVLERFVRIETARSTDGNGLGLSLAKAVMNLHQGEINLSNTTNNPQQPGLTIELRFKPYNKKDALKANKST